MNLPQFRYHPDPLQTGSIQKRDGTCACCGREVEFLYVSSVYSTHDLRSRLCPWCVADGSAHARFGATFSDDYSLLRAGLPLSVVEEVTARTPGYDSWQQETWLAHCGDACAFIGDATKDALRKLTPEQRAAIFDDAQVSDEDWSKFLQHYASGGDPAVYHFRCLHCGTDVFGMDCS